jgi:hypothetical protein
MSVGAANTDHFGMHPTSATPQIRRLVLVPATASGRGDELVRRYRLARLRLEGREAASAEPRITPSRSG